MDQTGDSAPSERLLRVALLPTDTALEEWDRLRPGLDLTHVRAEDAIRLLPLVQRSLADGGSEDAQLPELQAIVRQTWFANELLFDRVATALDVLDAVGARSLALKGIPLALCHYPHQSLRPMADADLLVEERDALRAARALREAGWTLEWRMPRDLTARLPEITFLSSDGHALLDLHWRLVPWIGRHGRRSSSNDDALWASARPLVISGRTTLAPAPDDLLLHVVLHAYRSGWGEVPRWVADTVVLIRSAGDGLDWDRFVARVIGAHLTLPVASALGYASRHFDAAVPGPVLTALETAPSTRRELRKHRVATRHVSNDRHWLLGGAGSMRIGWARASVNLTRTGTARTFPPFLRRRFNIDHLWALPFAVASRRVARAIRTRHAPP